MKIKGQIIGGRHKPYPYQRKIIRKMAKMPVAILGAEMGTGKTLMALMSMEASGIKKLLVLCPAIAVRNWHRESVLCGFTGDIRVMSYDMARNPKRSKELKAWGFDGIILDEAHYLKNSQAKRTRAVYGLACDGKGGLVEGCDRIYALSGTIAPNNVTELYPHLRCLTPTRVKSTFYGFRTRYCSLRETRYGVEITGARNVAELKEIMRDVYIPLRQKDVLPDLPPLVINDREVDPVDAKEALLELKELEQHPEIQEMLVHLENASRPSPLNMSEHVATLRRLIGTAKVGAAVEYILDIVEHSQEKLIVFCYHKHVMDSLEEALVKKTSCVRVDGSCTQKQRATAIDKFRNDKHCRVFLGQLNACGTAITLTEANQVVFIEQDWTPANNLQAAKRAHRIGQDRPVYVNNLMLHNSIDERISAALTAKTLHLMEIGLCAA